MEPLCRITRLTIYLVLLLLFPCLQSRIRINQIVFTLVSWNVMQAYVGINDLKRNVCSNRDGVLFYEMLLHKQNQNISYCGSYSKGHGLFLADLQHCCVSWWLIEVIRLVCNSYHVEAQQQKIYNHTYTPFTMSLARQQRLWVAISSPRGIACYKQFIIYHLANVI